jgi:hypothetical protein
MYPGTRMNAIVHIGRAAQLLNVTREHLGALERAGRIPPARRHLNGRTYTPFDNCNRATIGWRGGAGEPRAVNARALLDNRRIQDVPLSVDRSA